MKLFAIIFILVFIVTGKLTYDFLYIDKSKYTNFKNDPESRLHTISAKSIPKDIAIKRYGYYLMPADIQNNEITVNGIADNLSEDLSQGGNRDAVGIGCFEYTVCYPVIYNVFRTLKLSGNVTDKYIVFMGPIDPRAVVGESINKIGIKFVFVEFKHNE